LEQIDDDASLSAVIHLERRTERQIAADDLPKGSSRIADSRGLDLDDVCSPIGQHATGRGSRNPDPDLDDAHSLQRTWHLSASRNE
jgi:hypothetical protein